MAHSMVPWWYLCWWPQRGNNKLKHYANNGMYRAQIPQGGQKNLPYSKLSVLGYAVEGAQLVVHGKIGSQKHIQKRQFKKKFL